MAARNSKPQRPPAASPEARESEIVALAYDQAEKMIANGTASSQIVTHFLKMGSTREQYEQERLRNENILLQAKQESLAAQARIEDLYKNALNAMRGYQTGDMPSMEGEDLDEEEY